MSKTEYQCATLLHIYYSKLEVDNLITCVPAMLGRQVFFGGVCVLVCLYVCLHSLCSLTHWGEDSGTQGTLY